MATPPPPPLLIEPFWDVREPDAEEVTKLVRELGVPKLVGTLLVNRRITDLDDARRFLTPRLKDMPDPFTMKGMDVAVERIMAAMGAGESICVWGDYDVDGVTSASQLIAFFRAVQVEVRFFVPDRFTDGYGLNGDRIRELAESGVQLLITVDCGVSNRAEVEIAREHGMDVIVVDHHQVPPQLPDAVAVLDPVQDGCEWPEKTLAACGVTWVLIIALRMRMRALGRFQGDLAEPDLRTWLDLTAIGTVADMVPLIGLNRVIVQGGLAQIAKTQRVGVKALCDVSGIALDEVTAGRIGFHLGPRINAAGRVAHASAGVELLTSDDHAFAETTAKEIDAHNVARRGLQQQVFVEACRLADEHPDPAGRRAVVLAREGWHPGVLGIVASKLVERYHRPTVLLTIEDGVAKGSARSISGFKLVQHLRHLEDLLLKYGGHDHAAGMSMRSDSVEAFAEGLDARAADALTPRHLRPRLSVDAICPLDQISFALVEQLGHLSPYGMGNPEPSLMALSVRVLDRRIVGKDQTHLKLTLDAGGSTLDAIAFGMAAVAPSRGDHIDVVYIPEINVFREQVRLQLRVKAMRPTR